MLERNSYYHIYNRGVDASKVFHDSPDFEHFLSRFKYYLSLSVEAYAYCLLNNHFHFLIRVCSEEEQSLKIKSLNPDTGGNHYYLYPNHESKVFKPSTLIGHWLNSYSKYFNKKYTRSGPVWDGRIKHKSIENEEYLSYLICYIHRNPIHHGISPNYSDYPFSSYSTILNRNNKFLTSDKVISLFGGLENYKAAHQEVNTHVDLTKFFKR